MAIPFLAVRMAYLLLSIFDSDQTKWNALEGDVAAFVLMVLLMEYVVVWLFLGTGYWIPASRATEEDSEQHMEPLDSSPSAGSMGNGFDARR